MALPKNIVPIATGGVAAIAVAVGGGYWWVNKQTYEQTNNAFGRKVVWCAPAYADKKMYVRNDKEIICVDLAK